jgi:heterodisulfide reductase subunit A
LEGDDIRDFIANLLDRTQYHRNIKVYLNSEVTKVNGHIGNFLVTIAEKGKGNGQGDIAKTEISCGAIIAATGGEPAETREFLYGESENILTQMELEHLLHADKFKGQGKNIIMIQCVGSRNDQHPYCSRICCSMAVKNALSIKKKSPDANIYILYRDIRTYGFREKYYRMARDAGIVFIRYNEEKQPIVSHSNGLLVTVDSPDVNDIIEIEADNVILSTGIGAPGSNRQLSDMLKLQLNADGFFLEAHVKLRPVDFATEGIYLCGLAHSPKMIDENISQARAAASRAATVLSKTHLDIGAEVSEVDQDKCISCMTCVHVCPYSAPFVNVDNKSEITAAKCMGCGICVSECPACAIQLNHFESQQFNMMLDNLLDHHLTVDGN